MKIYKRKYNSPEYRKKYTGIYGSWYAMKQRCGNPKNKAYHNYGGRGITFIDKWSSFEGFKEDMETDYKKGLTLERKDVNGNYCRENCTWATKKQQTNNMRKNVFIEFRGQRKTLAQWAQESNVGFGTFRSRYYRGMTIEEIFREDLYRPAKLNK